LIRPQNDEYADFYHKYISLVADDVIGALTSQIRDTVVAFSGISAEYSYAPDKWTVAQMLGHMIDTERIFAYRALRIARGDATPLPGFEQDDYVRNFPQCPMPDLIAEFRVVRQSTVMLFEHLDEAAWSRKGVASQNPVSVRALAFMIAGHELHHGAVLKEKYLAG
jgi:hypothetical protein